MTFTLKTLSCFIASAAILFGASNSIAANRPAPSVRSAGSAELAMQVLLDPVDFSPGQIDGKGGKNSREALAAFEARADSLRVRAAARRCSRRSVPVLLNRSCPIRSPGKTSQGRFSRQFRKTRRSSRNFRVFTTHPCWKSWPGNSTRHRPCSSA